jgi:hypothetical protein
MGQNIKTNIRYLMLKIIRHLSMLAQALLLMVVALPAFGQGSRFSSQVTQEGALTNNSNVSTIPGPPGPPGPQGPPGAGGAVGGTSGQLQYNNGGVLGGFTMSGSCTFAVPVITCSGGSGSGIPYGIGGGAANAQTVTTTPNITSLTAGTFVTWLPVAANTTSTPTLAAGTTASTTITECGTVALRAGDLLSTVWALAQYDGTEWVLQNPINGACEGGVPTTGGTANAQTLTLAPVLPAYFPGLVLNALAGFTNTGAMTLNVGPGAVSVTKCGTTALVAGDWTTTNAPVLIVVFDGTEFQLLNPQATPCASLQGTDANLLTSGTVSASTGVSLCTDANHGATTTGCSGGGGTYGSAINPGITHIDEEFFWNTANVGTNAGLYNWTVNVIGAQANCNSNGYLDPAAASPHDGVYQITTDATAAHGCAAAMGRSNASLNDPFIALDTTTNYDSIFIFKLSTTTTLSTLVGFVNTNNVQLPTNQIAVRFDNTGVTKCGATQTAACADTNFTFVTCKAAACQESTTNSIAATSANYVKVRIRSTVAGSWAFSICSGDGCTLGTETTLSNGSSQVPSLEMSPDFQITAGAAASVVLNCDKFEIVRNPDGR